MNILGIDVGGTGIKGAPVDTDEGKLLAERHRILTPSPATPEAVADCIADIVKHFKWKDRIGVGFPSVIKNGVVMTAANVDKSWIGTDGKSLIEKKTKCKTNLMNDADAAGLAEIQFGAGRDVKGIILMVTIGTGIGTALFLDGNLIPNTELGHIEIRGKDAETRATEKVRQEKQLSWKKWGKRLDEYLDSLERLLWPDLIIVGGGASNHYTQFAPYLTVNAKVVPAQMLNEAGIIGAALGVPIYAIPHPV